ncbi:MAG: XcyI family restriction endonuclease [bacterium]
MCGKRSDVWHTFAEELSNSSQFSHYTLRSQFFARRLRELGFLKITEEVRKLLPLKDSFRWDHPNEFGIDDDAFKAVAEDGLEPMLCFARPRAIAEQPSLILYYRCLAMISQKGMTRIAGGNLPAIERGELTQIDEDTRAHLVTTVNRLLSVVILSFLGVRRLTPVDLQAFLFAQAGAQIQGSWNNAVGKEGEMAIRELLIRHLRPHVLQVVWKDDTSMDSCGVPLEEILSRVEDVRVLRLENGYHCVFSSEPDVSLRDPDDTPVLSVEVKAGKDPAGALERFGAALKSFEHEFGLNPHLRTTYVADCLTPEVAKRIQRDPPFSHTFLLSELLADQETQRRFANCFAAEILPRHA